MYQPDSTSNKQTHLLLLLPCISESKGEIFLLTKANPSSCAELGSFLLPFSLSLTPHFCSSARLPYLPFLPAFDAVFLFAATPSHCGLAFSFTTSLKSLSSKKSPRPSSSQTRSHSAVLASLDLCNIWHLENSSFGFCDIILSCIFLPLAASLF